MTSWHTWQSALRRASSRPGVSETLNTCANITSFCASPRQTKHLPSSVLVLGSSRDRDMIEDDVMDACHLRLLSCVGGLMNPSRHHHHPQAACPLCQKKEAAVHVLR
mmetsp:Transcript_44306/g.60547  ORF Transcript_44306/g.60547 Transcript_44306/m.60547 type:complete len:107 (-) Transcript_44306:728-1048(-)